MYVKSMLSRIKGAPSKAWNDWKVFRNYPGMEYRDVHNIIPKSVMLKYPSSGSVKYENFLFNRDYFKWDYKLAYRYSPYFIRRIFPEQNVKEKHILGLPENFEGKAQIESHYKENYKNFELRFYNSPKTLAEKHEELSNIVKNLFEQRDLLNERINF